MTTAVVLILFICLVSAVSTRLNELFYLAIRNGRVRVVRGHVSATMLEALTDALEGARVRRGSIHAISDVDRPHLIMHGIPDGVQQRLRDAFGAHHLSLQTWGGRSPRQ